MAQEGRQIEELVVLMPITEPNKVKEVVKTLAQKKISTDADIVDSSHCINVSFDTVIFYVLAAIVLSLLLTYVC